MGEIEIKLVTTRKDLNTFLDFPFKHYKNNPYWCPQLRIDDRRILNPRKNYAFEHCEAQYWLALEDGVVVGRIAGIINHKAIAKWNEKLVRFGWIEFIDDFRVSEALINTVFAWGRSKGLEGIHGPLGFTDMDNEGMLIEGFDKPANISSIYNYPYYPEHMIKLGFEKAADWVQYEFSIPKIVPEKFERTAAFVMEKFNLRVFKAKRSKELRPYARKMFTMLNVAFDNLYGYAPLTVKQMDAYTDQYFGFIRPEFVSLILDEAGDIVGFGISMPSLTKALQKTHGRLLPFGFIEYLKAIRKTETIDMYLVGVRPDYHGKGVAALIWCDLHEQYVKYGVKRAISNPQLEDNNKALSIWKNFEGRKIIQRRCWIKHQ
jgi:hypothetical protein